MDDQQLHGPGEEEYEPDLIVLEDETGQEHTFEVLDATDIDGSHYLALVPYSETPVDGEDEAELLIMRLSEEEGEEILDIVEDENELQLVGGVFLNRLQDLYDIDIDTLENS